MLLSITTTHQPATDLGYLLHKNPGNTHETSLSFGSAFVFFPEATDTRCTACLSVDVDPIQLVRGRRNSERRGAALLDHYVNDRPYAVSSFLSVALARTMREAIGGRSKERPDLAAAPIPLEVVLTPLPCRGGEKMVRELFEPLGYAVEFEGAPLDPEFPGWGDSVYGTLKLQAETRLSEFLTHLYVLIPVLDNQKHYWVGSDEVEKLLSRGEGWLEDHPAREVIANRYLRKRDFAKEALSVLEERAGISDEEPPSENEPEEALEKPIRLNDLRYEAITAALLQEGARRVCDLGCGEGNLIRRLLREREFARIVGIEVSPIALERAARRLKLERMSPSKRARVDLFHGSFVYDDARLEDFDAITLVEVIEHVDAERLDAVERVVFARARPRVVIVSTPNVEYNATFENMSPGNLRHPDHRFEWTREEFRAWVDGVCSRQGYSSRIEGIGEAHEAYGPPTQMAVFTR